MADRKCEFCGCNTNANVRACCRRGKEADLHRIIEEADAEIRARQPEPEPHYLRPVQASLLDAESGCERGRGSVMACGSSPMCGCPAALAELERNPDAFGVAAGAKRLPMVPTNHMMNAAVNAWHSWKSRDSGGNVQLLGRLMWEHMADAAPAPGAWDDVPGVVAGGAPGSTDAERASWLADKIVAQGDYAKEAAAMLRRWPDGVAPIEQPRKGEQQP